MFIRTHDCAAACIYETIRLRSVSDSSVTSVYTVGTKKRLQLFTVPLRSIKKGEIKVHSVPQFQTN